MSGDLRNAIIAREMVSLALTKSHELLAADPSRARVLRKIIAQLDTVLREIDAIVTAYQRQSRH
jgi:ribosomal protein L29